MGLKCCKNVKMDAENEDSDELIRFLMVGMGGAGKSTVIRQLMKLCTINPNSYQMCDNNWTPLQTIYTEGDMFKWKAVIQYNILETFCKIIRQSKIFGYKFENNDNEKVSAELLEKCGELKTIHLRKTECKEMFKESFVSNLLELLADENDPIKRTLKRCHEFTAENRLSDGFSYFINAEKIKHYSYEHSLPTEDDIVHARDPTTSLDYYQFKIHKLRVQIHDMGGQVTERKKTLDFLSHWISGSNPNHTNFILFVTSMADFNILHPDNPQYTLMDESLAFMKMILNLNQVQDCGFLIFFNKCDIFHEKINDKELKSDYKRYLASFVKADILKKFEQGLSVKQEALNKAVATKFANAINNAVVKRRSPVHHKYTCAVDSAMMEGIFSSIRNELVNRKVDNQDWIF